MLLGAAVLPGVAAAATLAPSQPAGPDAALMQAIGRFRACHARVLHLEVTEDPTLWGDIEAAAAAWDEAAEALCAIPPVTAAGLAAKAATLGTMLLAGVGDFARPQLFDERAEPHDRLAMALVQDVLRLTGGAA
ncbi:MAG: hypothetical protein EOP02_11110 [Proteobacteria bacterium]|nr:MAG: hypothetical protein EOP02_11110 [Pseudomonadota bacterium]